MAFQTGSQINPNYGTTDYSPFLLGATKGAEMAGRGGESIGRGVSLFSEGINKGLEKYKAEKDESDNLNQAAEVIGSNLLKYAQEFSRNPDKFSGNNPVDDNYLEMLTGIAGKSLSQKRAIVGSGAAAMASASNNEMNSLNLRVNQEKTKEIEVSARKREEEQKAFDKYIEAFGKLPDKNISAEDHQTIMTDSGMGFEAQARQLQPLFGVEASKQAIAKGEADAERNKTAQEISEYTLNFIRKNPTGLELQPSGDAIFHTGNGNFTHIKLAALKAMPDGFAQRYSQNVAIIDAIEAYKQLPPNQRGNDKELPQSLAPYLTVYTQNSSAKDFLSREALTKEFLSSIREGNPDPFTKANREILSQLGNPSRLSTNATAAPTAVPSTTQSAIAPVATPATPATSSQAATTTPTVAPSATATTTTPPAVTPVKATATASTATPSATQPVAQPAPVPSVAKPAPADLDNPWTATDIAGVASGAVSTALVGKSLAEAVKPLRLPTRAKVSVRSAGRFLSDAVKGTGSASSTAVSGLARFSGPAAAIDLANRGIGKALSDKNTGDLTALEGIALASHLSDPETVFNDKKAEQLDNLISKRRAILRVTNLNKEDKIAASEPLTKRINNLLKTEYIKPKTVGQYIEESRNNKGKPPRKSDLEKYVDENLGGYKRVNEKMKQEAYWKNISELTKRQKRDFGDMTESVNSR